MLQKQTIPTKGKQSSEWWMIVLLNLNVFEFLTCDKLRKERTATVTWKWCCNTRYSELELKNLSMKINIIDQRALKQLLDTVVLEFQNYTIASLKVFNKTKRKGTSREYLALPLTKWYCKDLPPQCDSCLTPKLQWIHWHFCPCPAFPGFLELQLVLLHHTGSLLQFHLFICYKRRKDTFLKCDHRSWWLGLLLTTSSCDAEMLRQQEVRTVTLCREHLTWLTRVSISVLPFQQCKHCM